MSQLTLRFSVVERNERGQEVELVRKALQFKPQVNVLHFLSKYFCLYFVQCGARPRSQVAWFKTKCGYKKLQSNVELFVIWSEQSKIIKKWTRHENCNTALFQYRLWYIFCFIQIFCSTPVGVLLQNAKSCFVVFIIIIVVMLDVGLWI